MASNLQKLLQPTPPPSVRVTSIEEAHFAIENLNRHLKAIASYTDQQSTQLNSSFLVKGEQVDSLSVDKLLAGTIATDKVFLGGSQFELNGLLKKIIIKDAQDIPVTRLEIGSFGAGAFYGLKVWDAAGALIFQVSDTTFIDGGIISNATIGTLQIADNAITTVQLSDSIVETLELVTTAMTTVTIADGSIGTLQIANSAITNAKIADSAIDTLQIASKAITNAKIADSAIDTLQIANDAITTVQLSDSIVETLELVTTAMTTVTIADWFNRYSTNS